MLVNSLQKMEEIVNSSSELEWDGWDVVRFTKQENAIYSSDGVYRNGSWYKKRVFPITNDGWHLPNGIGKRNAQVER